MLRWDSTFRGRWNMYLLLPACRPGAGPGVETTGDTSMADVTLLCAMSFVRSRPACAGTGQSAERGRSFTKKRTSWQKEEAAYDIPPVRSARRPAACYACVNIILRATPEPVFCSRACRPDTITKNRVEFAKDPQGGDRGA